VADRPERIVLVGLPGAGKSTVGPILAVKLGWTFVDLDVEIENATGLQIAEIFLRQGEAGFRKIERELTLRLASETRLILAPGGGWVLYNTLPNALMVWLQVDPLEAYGRMGEGADVRPLLKPNPLEKLEQLLANREQYYAKADITIDTNGKTPAAVALEIIATIKEENGNQEER
jgi:shikimate kinase